jgi:hypothetical protein
MENTSTSPASEGETAQHRDRRICAERYRDEMERLRQQSERLADPDLTDEAREEIDAEREPLSIEPRRQLKILLSWGGPSDGYLLTFDAEGQDVLAGCYWYADWFTYAEESLSPEEIDLVVGAYLGGDPRAFFPTR